MRLIDADEFKRQIAGMAIVNNYLPEKVTDIHVDEYYCPACGSENCCDQGIVGDK